MSVSGLSEAVEAILAAVGLIDRVGATDLLVGHLGEEDDPVGTDWYAYVSYEGARITAQGGSGPWEVLQELAVRLLTGATCGGCGKPVATSGLGALQAELARPAGSPVAAYCRWVRIGPRWEMGCQEVTGPPSGSGRGDGETQP